MSVGLSPFGVASGRLFFQTPEHAQAQKRSRRRKSYPEFSQWGSNILAEDPTFWA